MNKKHYGTVSQGRFIPNDKQSFKMEFYKLENSQVFVTVGKATKSRSNNQNKYYWGVVIKLISEVTGYTQDEAHDAMRMQFLLKNGDVTTIKSTSGLTTGEFEEYLENIRRFASVNLNCYIPLPNEAEY